MPTRFCVGIASGAGNEARTRYLHLGKVALYQMSYARRWCPEPEFFSPLLYQLSYLGKSFPRQGARLGNFNPEGTNEMGTHLVGDGDPERARTVDL